MGLIFNGVLCEWAHAVKSAVQLINKNLFNIKTPKIKKGAFDKNAPKKAGG
ncbi:hypothetical protein LBMAG43_00720 [Methylococcaceae bacterium]|nr:hypothetical protein LBMAG43_00720 [Methylococcaceae bacterium]